MNRRQVIRATGLLLAPGLAGCQTGGDPTATPAGTPTRTLTPAATATATPTDPPTDTTTEAPTETTARTTAPREIAADSIAAARAHLADAVAAYTREAGTEAGWTDVDATVTIAVDDVETHLDDARGELTSAAEHARDDQQATVANLRHLTAYVDLVAKATLRSNEVWIETTGAIETGIGESFEQMRGHLDDAGTPRAVLADHVDGLRQSADQGAADDLDPIGPRAYSSKIDQLAVEHATAASIAAVLDPLPEGMGSLEAGTEYYVEEDYRNAGVEFFDAKNTLADAVDALPADIAGAYAETGGELVCFVDAVHTAAVEMEEAADKNGDAGHYENAREALLECDVVDESPTASWLRDALAG